VVSPFTNNEGERLTLKAEAGWHASRVISVVTGSLKPVLHARSSKVLGPGGLYTSAHTYKTGGDEPRMAIRVVRMGDLGALWPEAPKRRDGPFVVSGSGSGLDEEQAFTPALAEALERYCASVFHDGQFILASGSDLGEDALDLDTIPRCSPSELSHPNCPITVPDKTRPIRWVRGLSLLNGHVVFIPAVMVYSDLGISSAERFWLPNSTGCAAHTSYTRALVAGIREVVERDAISITWLQKLSLPKLALQTVPPLLQEIWQRYMASSQDIELRLYDATTDIGVPTVYGVQVSQYNREATTLVSCATGAHISEALEKVLRDMASLRISFRTVKTVPSEWDEFIDVFHGAAYMARAEQAAAFSFLNQNSRTSQLHDASSEMTDEQTLIALIDLLRAKSLEPYAVDLSTDESIRSGIYVIRVVIPGLQPLSFRYRARYLGHSRLYEAPARMGYRVLSEEHINMWPQPFA
jgi:ribosomal protein S12 methylthiotransferase accessory factor